MPDQVFTPRQKQQAAKIEARQRGRVKPSDAEYQIAVIAAIEADYRKIADAEDAAGRLL